MTRHRVDPLLSPLAASLARQGWTLRALTAHLTLRLPRQLHPMAADAALHLFAQHHGTTTPDPATILATLRGMDLATHLHKFARHFTSRPAQTLSPTPFRPAAALAALPIPRLETTIDLADWLALSPDQLTMLADLRGLSARNPNPFARHYLQHRIPKSDGTLRLIEEPRPLLKKVQRRILTGILNHVPPHPAAQGFVQGRSPALAASKHCGEALVLTFDIKDFFPSVPFTRIYATFRALGFPRATALPLTGLCTAWPNPVLPNRHLPQGAPTSPALANLAALRLDARLSGLARRFVATYTRYADDLSFSGDAAITALVPIVPDIMRSEGFTPNPAKTRVQPARRNQTVTGITVNRHLNLNRAAYDLLKAQVHHLTQSKTPDPARLVQVRGRLDWLAQLNPARAARLMAKLAALSD